MTTVIFLRSQNPDTDSRLQRYSNILKKENILHTIIGWNREDKEIETSKDTILYNKKAPIGGGLSNILSLILWNFFLFRKLFILRKKYTIIHSIDFDTCIPAYIIAKFFKKKLIFDIYDKYTDARNMPSFVALFIDKIEKHCAIHSDELILPDECRIKQLNIHKHEKIHIIENVPYSNLKLSTKKEITNDLIFSYVGILEEKNRGIENLLNVIAKNPSITLHIAGGGKIEPLIKEMSKKYPNIIFHGQVPPEKALEILAKSDIIVGMYYKTIKNHLYASPNKYFEHLFLEKVLLTTEATPPGDKVQKYKTGFAIGETERDVIDFIINIDVDTIRIFSNNAKNLWNSKYYNYQEKLKEKYISLIKKK